MARSEDWDKLALAASQNKKERDYWLNKLSGYQGNCRFPYDYKKTDPSIPGPEKIKLRFPQELFLKLNKLCQDSHIKIHICLAAGLTVLLKKYTRSNDIAIGTPIYQQDIKGKFINTMLLLRNQLDENSTFKDVLSRMRQTVIDASRHQNYPIEKIPKLLNLKVSNNDFPLFDTILLLRNIHNKKDIQQIPVNMVFSFLKDGNGIEEEVEYNPGLYQQDSIKRINRHLHSLLDNVLSNLDSPITRIDMLTKEDKKQLLTEFNRTRTDYPAEQTIPQLFLEQVERKADDIAVIYEDTQVTYKTLNKRTDNLARVLKTRGVKPDTVVGLMMERSTEMMEVILGILKAGAAYMPIEPGSPRNRLISVFADSNTSILVVKNDKSASPPLKKLLEIGFKLPSQEVLNQIPDNAFIPNEEKERQSFARDLIILDFLKEELEKKPGKPAKVINKPEDLAYILFTSGTTAKQKGVMVEHKSVVRLVKNTNYIKFKPTDRILQTGALEFDATTFEMWGALLNGLSLYLLDKEKILTHQVLRESIGKYKISTMWMTSPLFNQMADFDVRIFAGLRNLLVGGDVLSPPHIDRVRRQYPRLTVINGYGPTENTTFSTTYQIQGKYEENIPIGTPIANSTAYIIDENSQPVPLGVCGELAVGGKGVARGYLNNPELTKEKFPVNPFVPGDRMYKTGDLARWLANGNIEFLGRMDNQVKIRGFRVEPAEIERQLLNHPHIKGVVVVAGEPNLQGTREKKGEKYLCAYIVPAAADSPSLGPSQLREYLAGDLQDHMIPSYFVILDKIPLTANGKIDRQALPTPERTKGGEYTGPRNQIEKKLVKIWAEILEVEKEIIDIDANFFQLGGHSLKATILASRIHQELNVNIPLAEIFILPTIRELAQYLKDAGEEKFVAIETAEKKEYYPLSSAQKRLYILQQMDLEGTNYNIPAMMELEGQPDRDRVQDTFRQLIRRHESFRTSFQMLAGEPVQKIHDAVTFEIKWDNRKTPGAIKEIVNSFVRSFDLSRPPLLRVGLIKSDTTKYVLMVDLHHIISDGTSMAILNREFMALYEKKELPPINLRYRDFSQWQNSQVQKKIIKEQENYWLKICDGDIPVLDLPLDYPRPVVQGFAGNSVEFSVGIEETNLLKAITHREDTTLYMILLGIFVVLLYRLSSQEDIVVGTPIAGRRHADLETIIGMFINTLSIRNHPRGDKTFKEFLRAVRKQTLEAFENQDYPFEDLVDSLALTRDTSRNPIFDVMFALVNIQVKTLRIPGLALTPWEYNTGISKFDITLTATEAGENLQFTWQYCTKLFNISTIERFTRYFKKILDSVLKNPGTKLAEIEILADLEKNQLLYDFNATGVEYETEKCIYEIFAEQVKETPDNIAVCTLRSVLTYKELNEKSNQLAGWLSQKGMGPDTISALMMERSLEMVTGILGILKTGGAYLPIDPDTPKERIKYILDDSSAKIILTHKETEALVESRCETVVIRNGWGYGSREEGNNPAKTAKSTDLAYVIYTSGSTGRPKGVMIENRSLVNFIKGIIDIIDFTRRDTILSLTTISFDIFGLETILPLTVGCKVVMGSQAEQLNPESTAAAIVEENVTILQVTPSRLTMLTENEKSAGTLLYLKYLLVGGEAFPESLLEKTRKIAANKIYNLYGPTETTIWSTVKDVTKGKSLNIGKPIANTRVYILGKNRTLQPAGTPGELCITGAGLARGYINNIELTAKKFVLNPYGAGKRLYRTGDLARWLPDGCLEFIGRVDQQIKIRGFRIELGEIENYLLKHPGVKEAVVTFYEDGAADRYICAYIVSAADEALKGNPTKTEELTKYLSLSLPAYMIPSYFVPLEEIPLTLNGKIHRKALPKPVIEAGNRYAAPTDDIEKRLVEIWSEIMAIEPEKISVDANFFKLGGHSLKAIMMISKIHKEFNVRVPLTEIFRVPTVRGTAQYIKIAAFDAYKTIEPTSKKNYYPLSSAQKRLYIHQAMVPGSKTYIIPLMVILEGVLDRMRLRQTFVKLVERHESLRTSFKIIAGEPVQQIHEIIDFKIEYHNSNGVYCHSSGSQLLSDAAEKILDDFTRPFDLSQAPLMRGLVIRLEKKMHFLRVDMHHIISDGISLNIFVKEFSALYEGRQLLGLRIQYKDFSEWQNRLFDIGVIRKQEDYWLELYKGEIPVLNIPTDYPRCQEESFAGDCLKFEPEPELSKVLIKIAATTYTTLYLVLLASFYILLSKYSNQDDIVVGTAITGRNHTEIENIIGMFVNMLALRNFPESHKTFREFLEEVKKNALDAFENQDYQFEELVNKLGLERIPGRNLLFDIVFSFQTHKAAGKEPGQEPHTGDKNLKIAPYTLPRQTSKFDLQLRATEADGSISLMLEYKTALFKPSTIEEMKKHYLEILYKVSQGLEFKLEEIKLTHDLMAAATDILQEDENDFGF